MLNPFKLIALYGDLNKMQGIWKAGPMTPGKFTQISVLLAQIASKFGLAAYVQLHFAGWGGAAWTIAIVYSLLTIGHALLPSLISAPPDVDPTKLMKTAAVLLLVLMLPSALQAQAVSDPANIYGAGVSYNAGAAPAIAGTGLYAHLVNNSSTYAFTAVDLLPNTVKPLTVTTNIGAGIGQKIATIGKVPIYIPTAAGISFNGSNTGWQWNTGALVSIHLKNEWYLMPTVRVVKSSVSNGTGYQPIVGVLFSWAK